MDRLCRYYGRKQGAFFAGVSGGQGSKTRRTDHSSPSRPEVDGRGAILASKGEAALRPPSDIEDTADKDADDPRLAELRFTILVMVAVEEKLRLVP